MLVIISAGKAERSIYMLCEENPSGHFFSFVRFFVPHDIRECFFSWAMEPVAEISKQTACFQKLFALLVFSPEHIKTSAVL